MPAFPVRDVTIPAGTGATEAFYTGQATLGCFQLPSDWTGNPATISAGVLVSNDGVNFTLCPVEGAESATIAPASTNGTYPFPTKFFNFQYGKLNFVTIQDVARIVKVFTRSGRDRKR